MITANRKIYRYSNSTGDVDTQEISKIADLGIQKGAKAVSVLGNAFSKIPRRAPKPAPVQVVNKKEEEKKKKEKVIKIVAWSVGGVVAVVGVVALIMHFKKK